MHSRTSTSPICLLPRRPARAGSASKVATIRPRYHYCAVNCFLTPVANWTNPATNALFFLEFKVEIPLFNGTFHVSTPVPDQDFPFPNPSKPGTYISDTYEGVATVKGRFNGAKVHGTAWNEQQGPLPKPKTAKNRLRQTHFECIHSRTATRRNR